MRNHIPDVTEAAVIENFYHGSNNSAFVRTILQKLTLGFSRAKEKRRYIRIPWIAVFSLFSKLSVYIRTIGFYQSCSYTTEIEVREILHCDSKSDTPPM